MGEAILPFDVNSDGRDFVVGDVHGCFRTLTRALVYLEFDSDCDRLFGVGDLVGRGPHSHEAVQWLESRFAAAAMGNWERAALREIELMRGDCAKCALDWVVPGGVPPSELSRWRDAFAHMPLAVTIETAFGPVGIVHAESPHRSWPVAVLMLQSGLDTAVDDALLGPAAPAETARRHRHTPVQGLRALIVGHRPVKNVERSANRWNIDTGAAIAGLNRLSVLALHLEQFEGWTFDVDETPTADVRVRPAMPSSMSARLR